MKFIRFLMRIVVYILFVPSLMVFIAADTSSISHTQSLTYGDTIVSYPQGTFELGFFNLGKPNKTYLGIRYKNIPLRNVVWVANVGKPINDSSAILKLNSSGNLVLTHNNIVVWSTDSPKAAQNPVAELLDSGNLVIRDENSTKSNQEEYLWQSFDYPSDTIGMPEMSPNPIYHYEFFSNKEEVYYTWTLQQSNIDASWVIYSALPADECDYYGVCGANSYCRTSASPMCECLQGFNPKSPEKWNSKDWSQGCVLKQPQSCKGNYTDEFDKYEGMKVPETTHTWLDENIDLAECKSKCLKNCSCMAYTNSNISGEGSGCVLWFGELFDIVMLPTGGQDLYIRIPASELGKDY
uniref:non-specific serine/threonine protein kinase n=1 Tax=Cajanus cajan TaxID=3821 RepID=A0A151T3Q5_CAJCA|nr:S-locus-specific glycoprotein S13 [Cajanus cajan]